MISIIVGNLFSLCAMISDSVSGTRKNPNEILAVQTLSQFFYIGSSVALKGYSSTVQNAVAIFRNLAAMKNIKSRLLEWVLILAGVILGIYFNNRGLLGWLPIIANLEYSVAVFRFNNNAKALKLAFIINTALYAVFNAALFNIVGAVSSTIIVISTTASLIREMQKGGADGTKSGDS